MLSSTWTLFFALSVVFGIRIYTHKRQRASVIRRDKERVLILGASSGIGREIAHQYAARGAKVCVVGRRDDKVMAVVGECRAKNSTLKGTIGTTADIVNVKDMVRVRSILEEEWGGIDTVIVSAGVSATRPLLEIAGVGLQQDLDASEEGIQVALNVAEAATKGNYLGPLIAAVSLIPILKRTSKSPSVLLISSVGAVIPAPSRTLYGSTKSASLLLYQALAIEHPSIRFSFVLPSTVAGDFRASAVDRSNSQPAQVPVGTSSNPNSTSGLKSYYVAKQCIQAVDYSEKVVFIPRTMRIGHLLYWIWPGLIENKARTKYGFTPK
ncbi:hypothetical protein C8R41DRAFT_927267 [Lentinula lateritia]|uniref:NAD(P)-binding protein n=1 Tax=Lentinula lateritia TaxID=40482 RepID=A0ABQ8V148_9AGAR|nr:hypothetical protein C8R41DRAFT_927267 [Lentinula lateritia]